MKLESIIIRSLSIGFITFGLAACGGGGGGGGGTSPTPTSAPDPGITPTPTSTPDPGITPTPTSIPDPGITPTPTSTPDPGATPTPTSQPSSIPTPTSVPGATPTLTPTTPVSTPTPTATPSATPTATPTLGTNTPPSITSANTADAPENTLATGYTATATDPDTNDVLSFSVSGGADQTLFTINPSTGVLSFINPPDFEQPGDADGNNNYDIEITVADGQGAKGKLNLVLSITNGNDAPTITSGTSISVNEGRKDTGYLLVANDVDGDSLSYSLAGTDAEEFSLSDSGELLFKETADYEDPADANKDNHYDLTLSATDGKGGNASVNLVVSVSNIGPHLTSLGKSDATEIRTGQVLEAVSDCEECIEAQTEYEWFVGGASKGIGKTYRVAEGDMRQEISIHGTPTDGTTQGATEVVTYQRSEIVEIVSNPDAFAALKSDGSVETWGRAVSGGESVGINLTNIKKIASSRGAFAGLKNDGTIVSWGNRQYGGRNAYSSTLTNVVDIVGTRSGFAALLQNKTVVTWGSNSPYFEGAVYNKEVDLTNIEAIYSAPYEVFSALKSDGSMLTWDSNSSTEYNKNFNGLEKIYNNQSGFIGVNAEKTAVTWGEIEEPPAALVNVKHVALNDHAYAVIQSNGDAIVWGKANYGGDASGIDFSGVISIAAGENYMIAVKNDGSLITWGSDASIKNKVNELEANVVGPVKVFVNEYHIAVLCEDGTVVSREVKSWIGGKPVEKTLANVKTIWATNTAFTALKNDGDIESWGYNETGGISDGIDIANYMFFEAAPVNYYSFPGFSVILEDGSVKTWGLDQSFSDVSALKITNATQLAVSPYCSAALTADGSVYAWGNTSICDVPDTPGQFQTAITDGKKLKPGLIIPNVITQGGGLIALKNNKKVIADSSNSVKDIDLHYQYKQIIYFENGDILCVDSFDTSWTCDLSGIHNVKRVYNYAGDFFAIHNDGKVTAFGRSDKVLNTDFASYVSTLSNVDNYITAAGLGTFIHSDGSLSNYGTPSDDPFIVAPPADIDTLNVSGAKYIYNHNGNVIIVLADGSYLAWGGDIELNALAKIDFTKIKEIIGAYRATAVVSTDGNVDVWGSFECISCPDFADVYYEGEDVFESFSDVRDVIPSLGGFYIVKNNYEAVGMGFVPKITPVDSTPKDKIIFNSLE